MTKQDVADIFAALCDAFAECSSGQESLGRDGANNPKEELMVVTVDAISNVLAAVFGMAAANLRRQEE